MTTAETKNVAVLGGGMTGLSAAFYLYRLAEKRGLRVQVTLLEAGSRLGGRVNTLRRDGFVIERGPDSFLARKPAMIRLADELGLEDQLTGTNPAAKKTYIARDGALHPMPAGLYLGIPTDAEAFLQTGLLSEEGKRRALQEVNIPSAQNGERDEAAGTFLERRFGAEMVQRIFEPLLAGIHAGDLYALGLDATFPQFREMERKYGSVIRGMMETRSAAAAAEPNDDAAARSVGSAFLTFRRGLSTVTEALEERLREYGCRILLHSRAISLSRRERRLEGGPEYLIRTENGQELEADAVAVALPASGIADLCEPNINVSSMRSIRYVSVANVVFGYEAQTFGHPLDGSGFLSPRGEGRLITASTWTSSKWQHTAPADKRLIRCYVGRSGEEENVELTDEEISAGVRRDLNALMGLEAEPGFVEITRLRHSMPQYPVGHTEASAEFLAETAARLPGIVPAGQPFGGVGLPDCVAQGKQAAQALVGFLDESYNDNI